MFLDLFEEEDTIISTERLALRLMREEDAEDIFEIRGDWDTASDAGIACMESIEDARNYIERWYEDSVVIVLGDEVIGLIESYCFPNGDFPFDSTFLGYYMKKSYRNMGYMTEALCELKKRKAEKGDTDLMLWIFPGNDASRRVALKCGWSSLGCHLMDIDSKNHYVEFFYQKGN